MSADWFCKIDGKKIGPLNAQQLKTAVAKGQIRPDHLVRRGEEGPWLPAGRIKGLIPEAGSKSSGQPARPAAVARQLPTAKAADAASLPTAQAVPTPPNPDLPADFQVGSSHGHGSGHAHAAFSVDQFDIGEPAPKINRRKSKNSADKKKAEQQKINNILAIVIGVGFTVGLGALGWAFATGRLSSHEAEAKVDPAANVAAVAASKKTEDEAKVAPESEWTKLPSKWSLQGNVQIQLSLPKRQSPPPAGSQIDAEKYPEVMVLPVGLKLKDDVQEPIALTSWADDSIKPDVYLKDKDSTANKKYHLLAVLPLGTSADTKTISAKPLALQLVFEPPEDKHGELFLELPARAFGVSNMIKFTIGKDQLPPSTLKKPSGVRKPDDSVASGTPKAGKHGVTKPADAKPNGDEAPAGQAVKKDDGDIGLTDPDAKK